MSSASGWILIPVQNEPYTRYQAWPSENTCGSMALKSSPGCEVRIGPWSTQLARSPGVVVVARPIADRFVPKLEAA